MAGLGGPEQSAAVGPLWATLADAFADVPDADVIVDLGQVHSRSPHLAMLHRASLALWVYRPTLWSVLHTRRRLEGLADHFAGSPTRVAMVAVARENQRRDVDTGEATVRGDWPWLRSYPSVTLDPKAVVMFEGGEVPRPERTLLARSGRTLAEQMYADLAGVRPVPAAAAAERTRSAEPVKRRLVLGRRSA